MEVGSLTGQVLGLIALIVVLAFVLLAIAIVKRPDQLPVIIDLVKTLTNRILRREDSSTRLPVQKRKRKPPIDREDLDG